MKNTEMGSMENKALILHKDKIISNSPYYTLEQVYCIEPPQIMPCPMDEWGLESLWFISSRQSIKHFISEIETHLKS